MDLGLADRVVLITGAGGGVGPTLAAAFAVEGAAVALHVRDATVPGRAHDTAEEIRAAGGRATVVGASGDRRIANVERDRGPLGRERRGQGRADAPSGSGDEDDSAGEPEIHGGQDSRASGTDVLGPKLMGAVWEGRLVPDPVAAVGQRQHVEIAHRADGVIRDLFQVPGAWPVRRARPVRSHQFSSFVARPS